MFAIIVWFKCLSSSSNLGLSTTSGLGSGGIWGFKIARRRRYFFILDGGGGVHIWHVGLFRRDYSGGYHKNGSFFFFLADLTSVKLICSESSCLFSTVKSAVVPDDTRSFTVHNPLMLSAGPLLFSVSPIAFALALSHSTLLHSAFVGQLGSNVAILGWFSSNFLLGVTISYIFWLWHSILFTIFHYITLHFVTSSIL